MTQLKQKLPHQHVAPRIADTLETLAGHIRRDECAVEPTMVVVVLTGANGAEVLHVGVDDIGQLDKCVAAIRRRIREIRVGRDQ
ncbi:hypothetical protein [Coralloluteibacterium thermophilus]|uniref:Uncharacterized protein n=1 Tax=Coralloluteibacterium thermophilum TaxID=2707049 RepID=A0ABV9NMB6_9GAMM